MKKPIKFISFQSSIRDFDLPAKFNYPFYYDPDPLCQLASTELQTYLSTCDFGLELDSQLPGEYDKVGKMFGVLLVRGKSGEVGYLAAYSGKLVGEVADFFVPSVVDIFTTDNYFNEGMKRLNEINLMVKNLSDDEVYLKMIKDLELYKLTAKTTIEAERQIRIKAKQIRKEKKEHGVQKMNKEEYAKLLTQLGEESIAKKFYFRELCTYHESKIARIQALVDHHATQIENLKKERKTFSLSLQNKIFNEYSFMNIDMSSAKLLDIFNERGLRPPAGSGECAAPKLLQYAFKNNLEPLSMAEFWWGASPKSEIRKHKQYYPACRGKCEPILGHMLNGMIVEKNPMLVNLGIDKEIQTVYEDEFILVIDKPAELLSVPGINIKDSVYTRLKEQYPVATGPLVVHRLDMSTSGLMLIAKTKEAHKALQRQFIRRTIKKRYVAVLAGELSDHKGVIDLPLRLDIEDRPRQLVCYEHGKSAKTHWKVIEVRNNRTIIHFYPVTGRTHQLRVHAAHPQGLDMSILGDDLYGSKSDRLYLHAELLKFIHPISKKEMTVTTPAPFLM